MNMAIANSGNVGLSNSLLLAQNNGAIALDVIILLLAQNNGAIALDVIIEKNEMLQKKISPIEAFLKRNSINVTVICNKEKVYTRYISK